jgi:hypothetical protein
LGAVKWNCGRHASSKVGAAALTVPTTTPRPKVKAAVEHSRPKRDETGENREVRMGIRQTGCTGFVLLLPASDQRPVIDLF